MRNINGLFFNFPFVKRKGDNFMLSAGCVIKTAENCYAVSYIKKILKGLSEDGISKEIVLQVGIPEAVIKEIGDCYCKNEEGYVLVIDEKISIYGQSKKALKYGAVTLHQLIQANAVSEMILFDYPDKQIRGYRVYTPGRDQFTAFKKMVDMLVYYEYNSMIIEIGGAMEYKKHPEINTKWVEFCSEVNKSPYEARRIQRETHPQWSKNSIHADNGNGSYITQEEMKELIAYCRERELELIPEVPSLSHSDYIVMAHPDLNERKEDTYPDTYCPSNPKSYEILFDILDEVISVFDPKYVNIGHDECYTLAKCDNCKAKDPVDLYVGDIVKINNFLKTRNVKAIMWCEKLFGNVYVETAKGRQPVGGTGDPTKDIPRLGDCAGKIPKDVTLLQWYWTLCSNQDEKNLQNMGYRMIYGNFRAIALEKYRERISGIEGGFVSNWGSVEEEYMQRNGQNYCLLTTAWIFWSSTYDNSMTEYVIEKVKRELYKRYLKSLGDDIIELEQTTDYFKPYKVFYDGYYIVPEEWNIGYHQVTYTDGTTVELPVTYGYNIRCCKKTESKDNRKDIESTEGVSAADREVWGATFPVEKKGKVFYRTAYRNPYPEKEIQSITCVSRDGIAIEVEYRLDKDCAVKH